jgi:hypothetical protein
MMQQMGAAQAQQRAADIAKSGAWMQGLDAVNKTFLPAAQATQKMGLERRSQEEQEKTGVAQRAQMMENMAGQYAQRQLLEKYGAKEKEAGLKQIESNINQNEAQIEQLKATTKGQLTQNEINEINLKTKEAEQKFYDSPASASYKDALPGENIRNYLNRMDVEGKRANTQKIIADAEIVKKDVFYYEKNQKIKEARERAAINASNASVNASNVQAEQGKQQIENSKFQLMRDRETAALDDFTKVFSGLKMDKNFAQLPDEQKKKILMDNLNSVYAKYGQNNPNINVTLGMALSKIGSDESGKKLQQITTALANPAINQQFQEGAKIASKITVAQSLVNRLKDYVDQYQKGARKTVNSDEAKAAAIAIQSELDAAASSDPRFQKYADKFKEINALWGGQNPIQVFRNFGKSPADSAKSLYQTMINDLKNDVSVVKSMHPLAREGMENLLKTDVGGGEDDNIYASMFGNPQNKIPPVPYINAPINANPLTQNIPYPQQNFPVGGR